MAIASIFRVSMKNLQQLLESGLAGRYHLERAFQVCSAGLIYLHVEPGYKPLRADPRFRELVKRIGLR